MRVHLVFHNAAIVKPRPGFLEGAYPDRRMVYLASMGEVTAKKAALVGVIQSGSGSWTRSGQ